MNTIYVLPIEPIENRYPSDWHKNIPKQLSKYIASKDLDFNVCSIDGNYNVSNTGKSDFLNFADTNIWKSSQMEQVSQMFAANIIKDGDIFLFTDAWNPTINQVKYMSELCLLDTRLVGIWHAGAYDPADILGQRIVNKTWARYTETSIYHALDANIFSTHFHLGLFEGENETYGYNSTVCGFPMEYMKYPPEAKKRNMVIFPHRKSPEKQHDIARDLKAELEECGIEMIICSDENYSKEEYYSILTEAKVCLSVSKQETLGIAQFEAMMAGAAPVVPSYLSYREMYPRQYQYDYRWISDFDTYKKHKTELVRTIVDSVKNYHYDSVISDSKFIFRQYFDGAKFYKTIFGE